MDREMLKGNYQIKRNITHQEEKQTETTTGEFERRALAKLGGSIAFVALKDGFVWKGEKSE